MAMWTYEERAEVLVLLWDAFQGLAVADPKTTVRPAWRAGHAEIRKRIFTFLKRHEDEWEEAANGAAGNGGIPPARCRNCQD